jgi:hypothetical protein
MSLEVIARLDTDEATDGDPHLAIQDRLCNNVKEPFRVLHEPANDEYWLVEDSGEDSR